MWKYNETNNLLSHEIYHSADELYHYGVLGMKWRYHRAARKGTDYTYKSHGQRKYEKKLNKLQNKKQTARIQRKIDKATKKLSLYQERDKNRAEYARKTNVGKALVKQMLLGPIGSGSYSRNRAAGYGRFVSALGSGVITSRILEKNAAKNRLKGRNSNY